MIPVEKLHVVASSGLFSSLEDKPEAIKANQTALQEGIEKACGLKVVFIDVKREA